MNWTKYKKIYLVFIFVSSLVQFSFAQLGLETVNWIYGEHSYITFTNNSISVQSTTVFSTNEGCASISSSNGVLLFYTDGTTVYNASHQIMANGSGLSGNFTSTQSALILRIPGSLTNYIVLTQGAQATGSLCYSIVDMSLAAGLGSVTTKNSVLALNQTEKLTVAKHCNGSDYWIITHDFNSNAFRIFLLNSSGINSTPVISNVGPNYAGTSGPSGQAFGGNLKVAPNNRLIAAANALNLIGGSLDLFDFNNSNGQVTSILSSFTNSYVIYGCEFSPNSELIYCTSGNNLFQFNLCQNTATLSPIATFTSNYFLGGMQLAPNGKIYVAQFNQFAIAAIANPTILGAGCSFTQNALNTGAGKCYYNLPNFSSHNFAKRSALMAPTFTLGTANGCATASFSTSYTPQVSIIGCNNSYTVGNIGWDFGDPATGTLNFSNQPNATHIFSAPGTYTIRQIISYLCNPGSDTLTFPISIQGSTLSILSTSINCNSLGSASVVSLPINIPYSYSWAPNNATTSAASSLVPGTYTIFITNLQNQCSFFDVVTLQPLIAMTGSIASTTSVTCNAASNGTAQVSNLQGGSANQNYLWANGTQSYTTAFTNSLSAGIWSVNVTDALTGCQINQSFFISQPPPLSPTLTISTPSICVGASAILSATNSGGTPAYTYTFLNGPVSFSSTITESISGTHVYTVQSTDASNCPSSATVSLNVIALPNLLVPTVSICPTAIALFTATGATTYTWLPPAANGSVTGAAASPSANINFTDLPAANTQYTLIGSDLGCTSTTTTSVFIYPSPTPIINSNSPKCEGDIAQIIVSGGTAAVWSGPNVFLSSVLSNTISSLGLSNAGVYSTTITSAVGCTASANSTFVVNPTPTLTAAGSTVCATQTMALFANAIAGSSYQWVGINNFNSLLQNPTLANPSLNRTGSYTVIVTAPTSCSNTAIAQVSVTTPPSLSIALSSNSLCAQAFNGSPNTITLTSSGANSYTLYTPNLLGSSTPITPSTSLFSTPPFSSSLAAGIATLQGSNGVCTSTTSFVFTVVPNPTVGVNSFTPVICAGKNFTYTSNGASSYVWSATSPNYTTYSNGGVAVAHPSINAVFSVYGSSLGCLSALVSSSITVFPLPTITLSALSSSICLYDKTNLSVSGTGTSFQWLPLTGLNAYTGSLVNCGTQVNQVYTVIATANNCTAAATTSIHVWPLPIAKITSTTSNVCLNDNIKLSGEGGLQFNWFGPGNIAVGGQSVSINAWSPGVGGTYTLVVTDINSCKSATTTNISILALPNGSLKNFKEEVCAPYCTTYNFEGFGSKNIQSTWVINSSTITGNLFSTCFKEAGTYTLQGKLLDNSTSCKSEISYVVNVHPKPTADFLFLPRTPIENLDEVVFNNTSSGDGILSYHWYFNDNKGFSTTNKNTSYLYSEPGDYRVVLVANNNFNCADTVLKIIHVEPDFALYVPNTFTPNEDNRNDVFLASVRSSKLFDLKIYDRWGAEIFHAKSPNDGWDGTFKGTACKQDTYTWVIELSTVGGERVVKTGSVLLLR